MLPLNVPVNSYNGWRKSGAAIAFLSNQEYPPVLPRRFEARWRVKRSCLKSAPRLTALYGAPLSATSRVPSRYSIERERESKARLNSRTFADIRSLARIGRRFPSGGEDTPSNKTHIVSAGQIYGRALLACQSRVSSRSFARPPRENPHPGNIHFSLNRERREPSPSRRRKLRDTPPHGRERSSLLGPPLSPLPRHSGDVAATELSPEPGENNFADS